MAEGNEGTEEGDGVMVVEPGTSLRQQLIEELDQRIRNGEEVESAAEEVLAPFTKPKEAARLLQECGVRWLVADWRTSSNTIRRNTMNGHYSPSDPATPGDRRVNLGLLRQHQSILQQLWPVGDGMWLPLGALRKKDCQQLKETYRRNAKDNLLKARAFGRIADRLPNDDDTVDEYWTEDELSEILGMAA